MNGKTHDGFHSLENYKHSKSKPFTGEMRRLVS